MREPVTPYAPPPPSPVASSVDALTTILAALERPDTGSAAANAFHAAIRRKGTEMVEEFGIEALNDAYAVIRHQAPDRSGRREAVLNSAWAGLPGWQA